MVVFAALASVADVAELQASVDIAPASDVLVHASLAAACVGIPGHPNFFLAVPNTDYYASPSSFVEVAG